MNNIICNYANNHIFKLNKNTLNGQLTHPSLGDPTRKKLQHTNMMKIAKTTEHATKTIREPHVPKTTLHLPQHLQIVLLQGHTILVYYERSALVVQQKMVLLVAPSMTFVS